MENKYYTPTIYELHEGFEMETKRHYYNGSSNQGRRFKPEVFTLDQRIESWLYEFANGGEKIDPESVRVKYLDKEDIEELGWKKINADPAGIWIEAKIQKDEYCWELFYEVSFKMVNIRDASGYYCTEFYGSCKNKSELKRLMNQLGITQP